MHIIFYIGAALSVSTGIAVIITVVTGGGDKFEGIGLPMDPISLAIGTFFLAFALVGIGSFIKLRKSIPKN